MIIVVMGVCGSGKNEPLYLDSGGKIRSSIGDALSKRLNCAFAEADQYHPDTNKAKMSSGIPLTDEDRWPWLLQLHDIVYSLYDAGAHGVVTCSALRKIYRQVIIWGGSALGQDSTASPHPAHNVTDDQSLGAIGGGGTASAEANAISSNCAKAVVFVYLRADKELLHQRLQTRTGHYMPPSLLKSQLDTLEEPGTEEQHITVDTDGRNVADIAAELEQRLRLDFGLDPDR